ncbi:MAG: hypothetical protein IPH81_02895 [Candidatus Microthrix sp.]|nr:hypothetical protein [Candidatus Microthrix sp.]
MPILLDGCENLAMLGLVVGLLVRHIEKADRLLDPYLVEPVAWFREFDRVASENSMLAASSERIVAFERRSWSLREAAGFLVVNSDDERAAELRGVGENLVATARRQIEAAAEDEGSGIGALTGADIEQQLLPIRAWASVLDRDTYRAERTDNGLRIESEPPAEIVEAMRPDTEELERSQASMRLTGRYCIEPMRGQPDRFDAKDLAVDLMTARELLECPPAIGVSDPWDVPAAVSARALEARLLRSVEVPNELLGFAADTVLQVAEGSPQQLEFEESYFEQGANRSAARVLPLLLLPHAEAVRVEVDGTDGSTTFDRAIGGGALFANAAAHEVRLHLARGLDHVWRVPCVEQGQCHHQIALDIAIESMRDSVLGDWNDKSQRHNLAISRIPWSKRSPILLTTRSILCALTQRFGHLRQRRWPEPASRCGRESCSTWSSLRTAAHFFRMRRTWTVAVLTH